jgi:hypothetical protein
VINRVILCTARYCFSNWIQDYFCQLLSKYFEFRDQVVCLLLSTVKHRDILQTLSSCSHQVVSVCWAAHGTLTIFYCCCFVEMADCSFASEIKFVPTLYLSISSTEYYDWEDAMKDFLWDRGLKSHMKIFFCIAHLFSWCAAMVD